MAINNDFFFQIWRQFGTFKHKILHLLCFIIFFVGQTFFSRLIYACAKSKTRARTKHAHESKNSFNKKFLEFNFPYSDAWKICPYPNGHVYCTCILNMWHRSHFKRYHPEIFCVGSCKCILHVIKKNLTLASIYLEPAPGRYQGIKVASKNMKTFIKLCIYLSKYNSF